MPLPLMAASAGCALFASFYTTAIDNIVPLPQRPMLADALVGAYIEYSPDPMPACDDAAWTLAGLDHHDGTTLAGLDHHGGADRLVTMGLYSHSHISPYGGVSLIFLGGDYSDDCTDTHNATLNLVATNFLANDEHPVTLRWINASSPACHTEFSLEVTVAGDARGSDLLELLHSDQEELHRALLLRAFFQDQLLLDEKEGSEFLSPSSWLPSSSLISVGFLLPANDSTEDAATPLMPPIICPIVLAIGAPALLTTSILLLAVAWRRRSMKGEGKAVPVLGLLPLEVERSKQLNVSLRGGPLDAYGEIAVAAAWTGNQESIFRHDPIVQTIASAIKDVGGYAVAEDSTFFSSVLPPAAIAAAQAQAALIGQTHRLRVITPDVI
ncbi:hypothetical protein T492DRAFT_869140, partial [Pavlovales sp. CCMP2436]